MKTLLIRAEDKNRWERRTPIVPADLQTIIAQTGVDAFVERSDKRFFGHDQYRAAGATICEGMDAGDVILGVKEIPVEKILPRKIYFFFSHTIKGQKANMPLLQRIIDSGSTLIDYERVTDEEGRRLIYFGRFAGDAGAIDILSLMGEHWAHNGIANPFTAVRRAHQYDSVQAAREHIRAVGQRIRRDGLPPALAPLTIGILGYGNVSTGAQQILDCLPTERIRADDIEAVVEGGRGDRHTVYLTVFQERDLVRPKSAGAVFDLQEYFTHPERYESRFDRFLSCFSILINAVYWETRYPRFVTWTGLRRLAERSPLPKLNGIADITCDPEGSIQCNVKTTDSDMPAYRVDPARRTVHDGHLGDGIVVLAVDNLPCELPNDASTFFSRQLCPFIPGLLRADTGTRLEDAGLPPEIQKAVIVYNGRLAPAYADLKMHLTS